MTVEELERENDALDQENQFLHDRLNEVLKLFMSIRSAVAELADVVADLIDLTDRV